MIAVVHLVLTNSAPATFFKGWDFTRQLHLRRPGRSLHGRVGFGALGYFLAYSLGSSSVMGFGGFPLGEREASHRG